MLERFKTREYRSGDIITVRGHRFEISIFEESRKTGTARIRDGILEIKIPRNMADNERSRLLSGLIHRVISAFFLPQIRKRVEDINARYFNSEIRNVRLKNNRSNWGSCSSKGNINLSSRLLLAPYDVLDYVIIHELAHTKELNHSDNFWRIVASIMPDFRQKEEWLRQHGAELYY